MAVEFNHKEITQKWQKKWEENKVFRTLDNSKKKKFYCLEMFPYPSASGLHMGHALNYTIGDIYARFKIMQGYNVLHPMGFDSFGLPAENAAIKAKAHPKKFTEDAIVNYIKQMKALGLSYDWDRMVQTHTPKYYKWDQWIFLKMFEKGLAYKKKSPVNWCSKCNTVLANEQVHNGKCWRHEDTDVEVKNLEQWFLKTTAYADELYDGLDNLTQWPEIIKKLQRNWIGKSQGTEIKFKINNEDWTIFTTRPDTLLGVTFLVISAQHPRLNELVIEGQKKAVQEFIDSQHSVKQEDIDQMEKEGVFTGSYATHPITNEKIPIYAGNFVLADYGSGMVMAVPAHDQRDFEFAKKYNIPIKQVIAPTFITDKGPDAIRKDLKTEERECVFGIIKHWKEDKYLCLDWKEFGWKSFVSGGIENNETPADAVKRETIEETGYKNIKLVKSLDLTSYLSCFVHHKNINRKSKYHVLFLELCSDEKETPKEEELAQHEAIWINKKEVEKFLNLDNNKFLWSFYLSGGSAFTEYGTLINSGEFDGLTSEDAKEKITQHLEKKNLGKSITNFRLRDWLISRQRFWGTPIPIVYCEKCGSVPVKEEDLPVMLPDDVVFSDVKNPLATHSSFLNTKCPKCNGDARRETDTMDTFVNSSWYYLRYADSKNEKEIFDKKLAKHWAPVDFYIGGKEHACMHLIYIRFYTKFFRDMGLIDFDEPAIRLFNQGMLQGPDGEKMSKSKGNVILPEVVSEKYGLDAARLFLVSVASPDKDINWSDKGTEGSVRFLSKIINYTSNIQFKQTSKRMSSKINKTIRDVTLLIENMQYNIAVIKIRELFESLDENISKEDFEKCLKLLSPICPHTCEELNEMIGNKDFITTSSWPIANESLIDEKVDYLDTLFENLRKDIHDVLNIIKVENPAQIKIIISQDWKYEFAEEFKVAFAESKDFKTISQKLLGGELKKYGQEMMKTIPALLKDQSKIPSIKVAANDEAQNIEDNKTGLEEEFKCKVVVEMADKSSEAKAKSAWPGKPALVIN